MKRLIDVYISLMILLSLSVPLLIISFLIFTKMGLPITFTQERPGINGKTFKLIKFRTMTNETDENNNLLPNDKRLTPLGEFLRKYSLDELPQLINVLKGDISLVGPRPLLKSYLELYTPYQARRHEVKPGITGWAQVNGRNNITWDEKFEYDVWYVENQNFLLDLKILLKTISKVLNSEGVNQEKGLTMERFKGGSKDE